MRTILHGFFALIMAAMATAASAQTAPKPAQIIVNNAPAGINIDVFLDAGKVQTVTANQQGSTGFTLDFLSLGKPQGQLYVEVCKDGYRISVVSDGVNIPADEGCDRRPVGVVFTFTCTKKITINFAAAKGSFAGCGGLLTRKQFVIPTLVAIGGGLVSIAGGGGDAPIGTSTTNFIPANTSVTVVPVTPPPSTTPTAPVPQPNPAPTTPTPPAVGDPGGRQIIVTCAVGTDLGLHNAVLRFCELVRELTISASGGGMTVTAVTMWMTVGGSIDQTTGRFQFLRTGPLSGTSFTAVEFQFFGTVDSSGNITGVVQIGGGGLPGGQHITYNITTRKG